LLTIAETATQSAIVRRTDPGFAIIRLQGKFGTGMAGRLAMIKTLMAGAMLALIAVPAHAQMGGGGKHKSDAETKTEAPKKIDEKAYKAALERIPEPKQKYDPWGVARPADPAKKPK
jgi:hypothetical protein